MPPCRSICAMRDSMCRSRASSSCSDCASLRALHRQHGAQFGRRQLVLQQRADLLERKAEVLQREDAVQPRQLADAVVAIAGLRVGVGRLQQAELVVEPQLPSRDLRDLGKLTDAKHVLLPARLRQARDERLQVARHAVAFGQDDAVRAILILDRLRLGDACGGRLAQARTAPECRRCRAAPASAP